MGKTTLARQKAIGAIGPARVAKLEAAGLAVVDFEELCRLKQRRDELERENKRLRQEMAAQVLREAMLQ